MFRGFIFDLDGTICLNDRLVPGADRVIKLIRQKGRKVVFISNKPLPTGMDYALKLNRSGIPANPEEIITLNLAMIRFLKKNAPRAKVFVIGESLFIEEIKSAGFSVTDQPAEIDYVIAAFDRGFDYQKLNTAFQAIKRGAHFIATHSGRTCTIEGEEIPDCGAIIAALEAATLKKVETLVGKPSPIMAEAILEAMGLRSDDCILIGDNLETDIKMAKDSGMAAGIVLTGVTDEKTLKGSSLHPDFIFQSIADVDNLLIG
jgi:HAD superfamily hydrolase (TIGR01450 family)